MEVGDLFPALASMTCLVNWFNLIDWSQFVFSRQEVPYRVLLGDPHAFHKYHGAIPACIPNPDGRSYLVLFW